MCKQIVIAVRKEIDPHRIVRIVNSFGGLANISLVNVENLDFIQLITLSDLSGVVVTGLEELINSISPYKNESESEIVIKLLDGQNLEALTRLLCSINGASKRMTLREIRNEQGVYLYVSGPKDIISMIVNKQEIKFSVLEQSMEMLTHDMKLVSDKIAVEITENRKETIEGKEESVNYLTIKDIGLNVACGVMSL